MKRFTLALLVGAAMVLATGLPASAQYGGGGGGTTTTTTTTTTPGEAPVQPRVAASVSAAEVVPGQSVTVTVPPVFAPGTPVTVNFVRANQGAAANQLGTGTAGANGAASESVTIPQTDVGVYFLYVTGVDADGNPVVALVAMVVRGEDAAPAAAAVEGDSVTAAAAGPVPTAVADVQTVTPVVEAAVVEAVTQQGAGVAVSPEGTLQVRSAAGAVQDATTLPSTGADDIAQQVSIGAALLLAGSGLVLLRRRGGFTK